MVNHRSGHVSDLRILFPERNIIVCVNYIRFHNAGSTTREIQEIKDCGVFNGSRRNVFFLFQLDNGVIVVEQLGIGALDLDVVFNGVRDDYRYEKWRHDDVGGSGREGRRRRQSGVFVVNWRAE
jgi:hypothetical protein